MNHVCVWGLGGHPSNHISSWEMCFDEACWPMCGAGAGPSLMGPSHREPPRQTRVGLIIRLLPTNSWKLSEE